MCLAVPGKIVSVNETDPLFRLGVVDFGGVTREVNLACVPEAVPGDYVIVHVGMALSVLDEETALQTRREMREIVENTDPVKLKDLEFTVVENAEVPEELLTIIEEKKSANFKLTYEDGGYLYIVVGYGEQNTGGYSIAVKELFLTSNAIYIDTNLIGPSKEEKITEAASYPYIVIKTEYLDKSVVFQ